MKRTLISILAVLLVLTVVVYSQSRQSQAENSGQLTLTIAFPKDRVVLLEPIPIKLSLENRTSSILRQNTPLDLERIKFSIEKPNGKTVNPKRLTNTISGIYGGTGDVVAGAKKEITDILQFELLKWFDQPGQYRIRATLPNGESSVSSDWVTLTVEEPTGADADAFEFVRDKVVTESDVILSAQPNIKEELLEKFPDSPYSDYVRYSLARWYENRDKPKAIELYSKLQSKSGFIYAQEVKDNLKKLERNIDENY